ncbi:alpha-(1-_3)-arabinofuranosyltransferase domain-containing protein [Aquihabitans sp. McL0605]|uniref:alpha-(1->3)-arabinofuranosyltransferase domain-containing protein n=1 Tax=Aquihabitans sp. McL0605 TaxID=3415671 RepID=UPI003CE9FE48
MTAVAAPAPPAPPESDDAGSHRGPPRADRPPRVHRGEATFLVIGAVLLAWAVIGTRWGVFTPDTRPDLYQHPAAFLRSAVQAWVGGSSGLGQGNFNAGAAPVGAVVWVIRAFGASPWMAVRVWRLLVLLLGAWGIRRYLGVLMGRRLSAQARVLATVFWVVNPYVIVAGSTTPILLPYALLPWTLLAFIRATRAPTSWRWPALFALGFFAQTGLNAGVVPFFQLLALPGHLWYARRVEGRSWRDLWRVLVRCGLMAMAVSLYWLLPSFLASSTGAGIASGTENPIDVARTSSYAETARGLGNWPLYGRAGAREFLGDYTIYLTSPLVLMATFLVPVLVGLSLWRSRARERLLVVGLLAVGLPVMVGMFPPDDPYPAGSLLSTIFDRVPAALAFRTTNKVGAVVVLAETIALVVGWRTWEARARQGGQAMRAVGIALAAVLLLGISAPLWNGGLYPLGYTIPRSWQQATKALDSVRPESRVLVIPGGTGGNYRWGMRSPDDLFPSLLDRPVAVRNTVVGRGDPAGNLLSNFDIALAQGALTDDQISTTARYLGATDVLVRNDLLTEEIGGAAPSVVHNQVKSDSGLVLTGTYGRRGTDTIPGTSGKATAAARATDPADAALPPVMTYRVVHPTPPITAASASDQVLTVGDGAAMPALIQSGIVDGSQPVRYVGDLDQQEFSTAVQQGGRVVLTDTNRRRAWDINRVANATSPTLSVHDDIDAGSGSTITRWPDRPNDQTVSQLTDAEIGADRDGFGLHPYGRPSNAFDSDPSTAWITGGFGTAAGKSIWIEFPEPRLVSQISITPYDSEPSSISAVRVQVGTKQAREAVQPGKSVLVGIEPSVAKRVEVTILSQTKGNNPVGISEISIDGEQVLNITRVPKTLSRLAAKADAKTSAALSALPLDVLFTRAQGSLLADDDDEESQLNRVFDLPAPRQFTFSAALSASGADAATLVAAGRGEAKCTRVAIVDGTFIEAKIVSSRAELAKGAVRLEGCQPLTLGAGPHQILTIFGWRLNTLRLSTPGTAPVQAPDPAGSVVTVNDRSATSIDMDVVATSTGPRYLRLGEAYDERWKLTVDGADAGPPIVIDGYSTGWLIDGKAHHLVATFGPQRAVQATFVASAAAVVGVTGIALLPTPEVVRRRRRRRSGAAPVPGGGPS